MEVYWSEIEFLFTVAEPDKLGAKGGCVYAFVTASDARDAINSFAAAVADERLEVKRIAYASPYGETTWEKPEDNTKFLRLCERAKKSKTVIFDEFQAYVFD